MFLIIGSVVVFACVLGGYAAMGGKLMVLYQPFEVVIIVGAAVRNKTSCWSNDIGPPSPSRPMPGLMVAAQDVL